MNRVIVALTLALLGAGCTANVGDDATDDLSVDTDDPAGKEDGVVRPVGTFNVSQPSNHGIQQITLFSDKTYHIAVTNQVRCVRAPCPALHQEETGTYRYTKSGRSRYIRFLETDHDTAVRYRYTYNPTTEHLSVTLVDDGFTGDRVDLDRDGHNGYCVEDAQCDLQDLPRLRCFGARRTCDTESNLCAAHCNG